DVPMVLFKRNPGGGHARPLHLGCTVAIVADRFVALSWKRRADVLAASHDDQHLPSSWRRRQRLVGIPCELQPAQVQVQQPLKMWRRREPPAPAVTDPAVREVERIKSGEKRARADLLDRERSFLWPGKRDVPNRRVRVEPLSVLKEQVRLENDFGDEPAVVV